MRYIGPNRGGQISESCFPDLTHLEVNAQEPIENAKTAIGPSFADERKKPHKRLDATYLFIYLSFIKNNKF